MVIRSIGMGITQPISHIPDRIPAYDKKKREHLWTVLTMYRIVDPLAAVSGATQLLDIREPDEDHADRLFLLRAGVDQDVALPQL